MFRRRSATTAQSDNAAGAAEATQSSDGSVTTHGKGRPTPKRRDAQGRRQPMRAPKDRKQAYRQVKQRQQAERRRARAGLAAGDERYMPARDKGPVRKLARDYVDSRRGVGQYFLFLSLIIIALTAIPLRPVQIVTYNVLFPLLLVALMLDAVRISRGVKRLAAERYPQESTRGLSFYAITRGLQIRRLRIPGPAVKAGDRI